MDQSVAGLANNVTFGGTNWLREKLYGDTATQNHEGAFYQGGEVAGEVATSLLPTGAFKGAKWAQQAVGGYNKARNIYDRFQDVSSKVGSINNILNGCGSLEDLQNLAGGSLNPPRRGASGGDPRVLGIKGGSRRVDKSDNHLLPINSDQSKHDINHNNFKQEVAKNPPIYKSIFETVPSHGKPARTAQELVNEFAGTGQVVPIKNKNFGYPGSKERVDFGERIGFFHDDKAGTYIDTTVGMIVYAGDGVHIVPARPKR